MHFTLSSLASATIVSSLFFSVNGLPNFPNFLAKKNDVQEKRQGLVCTQDNYYSVFHESQYMTDIIPFCSSFISISPVTVAIATYTPRETFFTTSVFIRGTTVVTSTENVGTVTAIAYQTDYVAKAKRNADIAARAVMTPAPVVDLVRSEMKHLQPRQAAASTTVNAVSVLVAESITSAISSACSCLFIPPAQIFTTVTLPFTVTRTEGVMDNEIATRVETTIDETQTVTTTINTTLPTGGASSTISSYTNSTSIVSSTSTETPSGSPMSSSNSRMMTSMEAPSGSPSPSSNSTISTSTTASAPTKTPTSPPRVCNGLNGTIFSPDGCSQYQYQCGVDYPQGDNYDLQFFLDTVEECVDYCQTANAGVRSPCLGISYDPDVVHDMPNCFIIESLDEPDYNPSDPNVISLVLLNPNATCPSSTTSMASMSPTPYSNTTTMPSMTPTPSLNSTSVPSLSPTPYTNMSSTQSMSPTLSMNSTTSTPSMSPITYTNSSMTASITPTLSMNRTSTPSMSPSPYTNSSTTASVTPTLSINGTTSPSMSPTPYTNTTTTPSMTPTNSMNRTESTTSCPICPTWTAPYETTTIYGNFTVTKTETETKTKTKTKKCGTTSLMMRE